MNLSKKFNTEIGSKDERAAVVAVFPVSRARAVLRTLQEVGAEGRRLSEALHAGNREAPSCPASRSVRSRLGLGAGSRVSAPLRT